MRLKADELSRLILHFDFVRKYVRPGIIVNLQQECVCNTKNYFPNKKNRMRVVSITDINLVQFLHGPCK